MLLFRSPFFCRPVPGRPPAGGRLPAFLLPLLLSLFMNRPAFAADGPSQEAWDVHAQSTYVRQFKPAFPSPYQGPNSLAGAAQTSYSFTATASIGLRLAPGTEVRADPEVAEGVPMSGLLGLAGFPNGELAKTSGSRPTFYHARLFVRQTFALPGEAAAAAPVEEGVPARRVVVTAGNLSVLDLFDANAFAHDPRTQFLNWALMTHAAYDYPADARGYSLGAALEYFDAGGSWRVARFEVPREPNQLRLDQRVWRHYGDQVEWAHDYRLGARQAGTARLLVFRMRAIMARYDEALALAQPGMVAPVLADARVTEQVKAGAGVAIEHRLSPDVGLFARWMRADGRSETFAFTEADRSWSAGASIGGARWGRRDDRLGLAWAASALSRAHQAFLAAGGTTFFLGDGRLRYRPETVAEAYYSVALGHGLAVTADGQFLRHPGYNADRGPVEVFGFRCHWEL